MKKILSFIFISSLFIFQTAFADKVAIIGGGAAGLVTAWLIEKNHDVTLYEAKDHLGGHAETIDIMVNGKKISVEGGTEFFNKNAYPHFVNLLSYFNIPLHSFTLTSIFYKTDGSDVIMLPPVHDGIIEWKSLTPYNINRSLQLASVIAKGRDILASNNTDISLQQFVDTLKISKDFKNNFFYPFVASQWAVSINDIQEFSAYDTLKYMTEGMDSGNFQWFEVDGGLRKYIEAVRDALQNTQIKMSTRVTDITKNNGHFIVKDENGNQNEYDQVVIATDASVAGSLLHNMAEASDISLLLSKVSYYKTTIAIHSDPRFMPPNKKDWRVVDIRYDGVNSETTIYKNWLSSDTPIFKSWLNYDVRAPHDKGDPMPTNLYAMVYYNHPVVSPYYFQAQKFIEQVQGNNNLWFVGMWTFDNDSHESAINSAIKIAKQLAPNSDRLKVLEGQ